MNNPGKIIKETVPSPPVIVTKLFPRIKSALAAVRRRYRRRHFFTGQGMEVTYTRISGLLVWRSVRHMSAIERLLYAERTLVRRRNPFVFSNLARCPEVLRSSVTGYLQTSTQLLRPFSRKLGLLRRAMSATGTNKVVDLCSGSGGPWLHLIDELERESGRPIAVVLTDRLPPPHAVARVNATGRLSYLAKPVDVTAVPDDVRGIRTMFNGLHLFRPEQARAILQNAVRQGEPIAVFESLRRSWTYLLLGLLTPLFVLALTPWMRPVRLSRLLWTYVVPIAPLIVLWDVMVSILGCYSPDELLAMAASVEGEPYTWEAGTYAHLGVPVTYLVGYPQTHGRRETESTECCAAG
jgi:hypothetical protein